MNEAKSLKQRFTNLIESIPPDTLERLRAQAFHQALPTAMLMAVMMGLYLLTILVSPGWVTYWLSSAALMVIWLTSVARVNDITARGKRWHVRRLGLVLCGVTAVALVAEPLFPPIDFPSWTEVWLRWGFALTWFTTPNMPPWWKFISGEEPRKQPRTEEPQL